MAQLQQLGVRTVPVVAKGDRQFCGVEDRSFSGLQEEAPVIRIAGVRVAALQSYPAVAMSQRRVVRRNDPHDDVRNRPERVNRAGKRGK